jgi:hypothetical protein
MVRLKKQISIILILSFFLSLIPNFLYTKSEEAFAKDCPPDCDKVCRDEVDACGCINCPISCQWGEEVTNKSCLPFEGTEEWTCGVEIPIGEVIDRSAYLAEKMLVEFDGIIGNGKQMIEKTGELLSDYKDWRCEDVCSTGCFKYYRIVNGILVADPPQPAGCAPTKSYSRNVSGECRNCASAASCQEECAYDKCPDGCCYADTSQKDIDTDKPIICKYCPDQYEERCVRRSCGGCCNQYFNPIIEGSEAIENFQENLKNDIEEKSPGGENLPDNFKFRRSYILEQVDFSRCELARCWIPAEDYYDILAGEKVGKHLLTCETATQMGLFDEDQYFCSVIQILEEWEGIQNLWEELGEAPWWGKPVVFFRLLGRLMMFGWKMLWETIKEWSDSSQEEGCYLTNYYCCQL